MMVNSVNFAGKAGGPKGMSGPKNTAGLNAMKLAGNGNSGGTGGAKSIQMTGYGFPVKQSMAMGHTSSVAPAMKKFMKDMSKSSGASAAASAAGVQAIQRPKA